jgi:hypothetical protein
MLSLMSTLTEYFTAFLSGSANKSVNDTSFSLEDGKESVKVI